MLHMAVLRSPHAHARIVSIDTSEAEAMPGVEGVITCADVPGEDGFGVFVHDQPVMARGKVRYVGEAVAAVAAEDRAHRAARAGARSRCVYEPLPAVFDPDEAMRPGAPVLHDYAPDNITKHIPIRVGDVEQGFAESDLIVEETYYDPAGRARLSRAGGRPRLCRSRRRRDHRLAEPEHHPPPPHAGAHHRASRSTRCASS